MQVPVVTIVVVTVISLVAAGGLVWWSFWYSKKKNAGSQTGPSSENSGVFDETGNVGLELFAQNNAFGRLKDYIRARRVEGKSAESALSSAQVAYGHDFSTEMFLRAAVYIGYPLADIVTCMVLRTFQPKEIGRFLREVGNLSVDEVVDLLVPFVAGDSIIDRADEVFTVMQAVFHEFLENDERFLDLPMRLGCSDVEAVKVIYSNSSLKLGFLIGRFKLQNSPESVAAIAAELDVRLSSADEYKALRDADVDFGDAVRILKACGEAVLSILDTEKDYEPFGVGDVEVAIAELYRAGFGFMEVVDGIVEARVIDQNIFGAIVKGALKLKVETGEIVSFLSARQVGPCALEMEMSAVKIDLQLRAEILCALYAAIKRPAEVQ